VDPKPPAVTELFADCRTIRDPVIERLAYSLIYAGDVGAGFGPTYADSVCMAVVVRLLDLRFAAGRQSQIRAASALTNWRLKRVTDYIEQHLAEPVGLADLAASAGLSRMHFAAQFRAATGMRPHDYLVWRRIERALVLLRDHRHPLCEVALDVGFKTQAHFTTVFKKVVGKTPNEWRHRDGDPRPKIAVQAAGAVLRNRPSISKLTDDAPRQHAA
jgi:AraC-like DNA-binding protein